MGILDFFSREAGQQRRAALNEFVRDAEYYVPPALRSRLGLLGSMTPSAGLERAARASSRMVAPDRAPMQRVGDAVEMLTEVAGIGAPALVASRAGMPAAQAAQEALLGFSQPAATAGQAAGQAYTVGDMLRRTDYEAPAGRPSVVRMPGGEGFDARPINDLEAAARDYMRARGMSDEVFSEYPAFSEERARLIAAAYDQMKNDPTNPAVLRAYDAMISETMDQYNALRNRGIDFRFLREGMDDPYAASPALGYKDLVENGRLYVYPTDFGFGSGSAFDPRQNPLLVGVGKVGDKTDAVANDAFRAVHDAFGHFAPGNPFFRRQGEERAFLEHSRMYSPDAIGAMTSETRGQNSWLNSGPFGAQNRTASVGDTIFADQKAGLMPSWTYRADGMPDAEQRGLLEQYIMEQAWN
jgi:hypothetical protein